MPGPERKQFRMVASKPPSTNNYWRHDKRSGRVLISAKGRLYRREIQKLVMVHEQRAILPLDGRLSVDITFYQADNRRRDLDNLLKCILDSMQHAGVYPDDSAIDRLVISRESGDVSGLSISVSEI